MPFDWLKSFHQEIEKAPDYAEKTLAAYRLGMKAKGSIRGVRDSLPGQRLAARLEWGLSPSCPAGGRPSSFRRSRALLRCPG